MMFFYIRNQRGFTLAELVIVTAIIGILAAIAVPSYQDSIRKGHRGDAKGELMRLAEAEEKWRVSNTTYGTLGDIGGATPSNYYAFAVTANTATSFTITATPVVGSGQTLDVCATLTITEAAIITSSDAINCPTP